MPTITSERIRSRLEILSTKKEDLLRYLLEQGAALIEVQRELEQDLREELRKGLEREALLGTLAAVRSHAEDMVEAFSDVVALVPRLSHPRVAGSVSNSHLHEAERFLAWVRDLESQLSGPVPPFDESRLAPTPGGPTAEGYISVSEARARVKARKKP